MSNRQYKETEAARDVDIQQDKRDLYEELINREHSPFQGVSLRRMFLLAMSYGYRNNSATELDGGKHALFGRHTLDDEQEWVINSIAIKREKTVEVLRDERKVYDIAQRYANGGIDLLHGRVFGPGDAFSDLTTEIKQIHDENSND